ncbi:MAG: HlyD family type I secretion periplasmic adaptor subunit [Hyphomicrobiales bacterium]|nr:MAG: HlyD family type I secretion periplasmic adaptor subunit [Hyphomicrobiales bacterium]
MNVMRIIGLFCALLFAFALMYIAGDAMAYFIHGTIVLTHVDDTPLGGIQRFVNSGDANEFIRVRRWPVGLALLAPGIMFSLVSRRPRLRMSGQLLSSAFLAIATGIFALDATAILSGTRVEFSTFAEYLSAMHFPARTDLPRETWTGRYPAFALTAALALILWLTTLSLGSALATPRAIFQKLMSSMPRQMEIPSTRDKEFLPAALEILATPPSPLSTTLISVICLAFSAALAWSYFSWIDIHAVASGKIQPSGRSKVVQPLEAGKVVQLWVENGAVVKAGEVLLELDSTETLADRDALAKDHEASVAEVARRSTAIAAAQTGAFDTGSLHFPETVGREVKTREELVFRAELALLKATLESLQSQIEEKVATTERLKGSIRARQKLISLAKERVGMREEIETRGAGSRAMIIEALTQYETFATTDATERGQLLETEAALISLGRKRDEAVRQFIADQAQKLAEVDRKRERLLQELIKAQSKSDRTRLRAPIDGTVQQLSITTIGQVVTSGQSLMILVPSDAPIEIEILLPNKDIGFVKPGQAAIVKVEAFPFTRYGTVDAEVAKVSRDAVEEKDPATLGDTANVVRAQAPLTQQNSRTQSLVFPATLRVVHPFMRLEGEALPLVPGMAVTAEIKTGRRRAISYLLSPLHEIIAQTARER